MTGTKSDKHAVVLSGGGANGAYEIGVMTALFAGKAPTTHYEPLDPAIFAGTSVGSYNAAFLVSRWEVYGTAAISSLERIWLDTIGSSREKPVNGVFRIRDNPLEFISPYSYLPNPFTPLSHLVTDSVSLAWDGLQRVVNLIAAQRAPLLERTVGLFDFSSFVSLEPFRQTVHETVWFEDLRRSPKELLIIATNWELGEVRLFKKSDMTDQLGPHILLASAAIPGFFPPQPVGAQLFADGGVLLNTPIQPAVEADADILHVISLFPNIDKIPLDRPGSTLTRTYRQQVIAWATELREEIQNYQDLNDRIGIVNMLLEAGIRLQAVSPDNEFFTGEGFQGIIARPPAELEQLRDEMYRLPATKLRTIHHYYPGDDISGPLGLLDFDRDRIKLLIQRGFEDAIGHDCERNKCVQRDKLPVLFRPLARGS